MKEWLITFKEVLLHPFNMLNGIFDNDSHRIVSKSGLKLLNKNYNMTPKEEADKLVKDMYAVHSESVSMVTFYFAKKCALIAVERLIDETKSKYWYEVRDEINKIEPNK